MDTKDDKRSFPIAFSVASSKLTAILFLGLFVGAQIVFSPIIDNSIESFLRTSIGLELPQELKMITFKSVLIFWLMVMSVFTFIRFIRTGLSWLINKKEKVFVVALLLSLHLVGITPREFNIPNFAVLVVLFFGLIYIFTSKDHKIIWNHWYLLILFFLFSILLSLVNCRPFTLVSSSLRFFPPFIAFFLMVNLIRDRETAIFSVKIYLLLATLSALIGIFQEIIYYFSGIVLIWFIPESQRIYLWQSTFLGKLLRVPAFTGWYLNLDYILSTALVIGINLMLYSVFKGIKVRLIFFAVLMLICLTLTFSGSSMLVVILAVIFSIFIRWRSLSIHFATIFLIGILLAYFSGLITDFVGEPKRYLITEDIVIRIDLLREGIAGFFNRHHPIFGNGIGTGARYISNVNLWAVHNNLVYVADELGLLGLFSYIALFFAAISRQVISILELKNEKDKAVLLSLLISLIALMTILQFQSLYLNTFLFIYLGLVEAIRVVLSNQVPLESTTKA